ncbi:MAG: hypothetical protein IKP73_15925 [Bacteroidales bacterium]|nr:hypothetical protein [Bacteroidales bacterium]
MKLNKLKYLLPALLFALPACTEDEDLMQNIEDSNTSSASGMEFTAINGNPQSLSKTSLYDGWGMLANGNPSEVVFTLNDRIGVFSTGEAAAEFAVKGLGDNDRKAIFVGEAEKASEYFALYPYQSTAKIGGGKITATIPTSQAVVSNNMDGNAALSVAYSTSEAKTFAFQNVTAMIAFRCTGYYTKITVEALDGTAIAGDIAIEVSKEGGKPMVTGGSESKITLEGGTMWRDGAYCVMLKPGTIKKGQLKFTFTKEDGTELVQTNEKDVILESGVCYNYGYIGDVKLTVYDRQEVAFVKYVDPSFNSSVTLPEIPCDEEGYVYVYTTAADGTGNTFYGGYNFWFSEATSLYLQKVKGYVVKIYDPEGTTVIYTKTMPYGMWYNTPYEMKSPDGKYYAFSSTKGGEIEYHRGYGFVIDDTEVTEKVLYAVLEDVFSVTIYGNGANAEPTFKQDFSFDESFRLPELPQADDVIYGYSTSVDGEIIYSSSDWASTRENLTLYVVSAPKVTINVYNNDGSLYDTYTKAKGQGFWLPWFETPAGYDYVKFATEPGGEGVYRINSWMSFDEGADLYVVYGNYAEVVDVNAIYFASVPWENTDGGLSFEEDMIVVSNPVVRENWWNFNYGVVGGFKTTNGVSTKVVIRIKGSVPGTLTYSMSSVWGDFEISDEWTDVVIERSDFNDNENADFAIYQGGYEGTVYIQSIKISHLE